jgi:integrase
MQKRVLNDGYIRALKPAAPGTRYAVSDILVPGLRVRVTDRGYKSFILWRRLARGSNSASALALGQFGQLTLAAAREKARAWLTALAAGQDPRHAERVEREATFAVAMENYLRTHVTGQRKALVVAREMRRELLPRFGNRPLTAITRRDAIRLIDEIKARAPHQARNVFGHLRAFLAWCVEKDLLETSPCDHVRPARLIGPKLPRQRVLNDDELRQLWAATDQLGYPFGSMVRMLMLTGQRKNEVAGARWREFDLANRLWTIPPERFKSDATHIVPLSDAVMALLASLPRFDDGDFLFSVSAGRSPINSFSKAKEKLDVAMGDVASFVIHDLRRTVRTRLSALGIQDHVAELVIGHARKGLARVYDQHRYLDEMRAALAAWAQRLGTIVAPPPANVVRLR